MKDTISTLVSALISCVVFLLLFFPLQWSPLAAAALSVILYFGLCLLLKPRKRLGGIDIERIQGGEELQRLLNEAQKDLKQIGKAAREITNIKTRQDAEALEAGGKRILAYLQENPEKIGMARRFFTYYLDTAAKLLARYVDFQNTGLHSEEVTEILCKTAESLPVLNKAFEKQFIHLMQGELLDVEADIELLKSTLKMEGGK